MRVKENSLFRLVQSDDRLNEEEYKERIQELYFIAAIFLLILACAGNFVAEVFSCRVQHFLSNNMLAKHFVILMIIYFTLSFAGKPNVNPMINLRKGLMVYGFFLLFNRMSLHHTFISISLLLTLLILKHYIDYYHTNNINSTQPKLNQFCDFLFLILVL